MCQVVACLVHLGLPILQMISYPARFSTVVQGPYKVLSKGLSLHCPFACYSDTDFNSASLDKFTEVLSGTATLMI
jgi:hypothetical protein